MQTAFPRCTTKQRRYIKTQKNASYELQTAPAYLSWQKNDMATNATAPVVPTAMGMEVQRI